MKFKKYYLIVLVAVVFICGTYFSSQAIKIQKANAPSLNGTIFPVYNSDNELIDEIDSYTVFLPIEGGVIYNQLDNTSTKGDCTAHYFRYDYSTKESIKLGTFTKFEGSSTYDTFYHNNHVYMLSYCDNLDTKDNTFDSKVYISDIDLNNNSISSTQLKNGTTKRSSMTLVGNELYVSMPSEIDCYIDKYNIDTKEISNLKHILYNMETKSDEFIRHISSDGDIIYILRLSVFSKYNRNLYVDVCDKNLDVQYSIDITDAITNVAKESLLEEDAITEISHLVSNFEIKNNYLFYKNAGNTSALLKITDIKGDGAIRDVTVENVLNSSRNLAIANNISTSLDDFVFFTELGNTIYKFDPSSGEIETVEYFIKNERHKIINISRNNTDDTLIHFYNSESHLDDSTTHIMYNVNEDDLK